MQIRDEALRLAKAFLLADDIKKGEDWNGYEVWEGIHNTDEMICIGYPFVILVKGEEVRVSTPDESIEHHIWKRKKIKEKEEQARQAQAMAEKCRKEADAVKFDPHKDN